uniref:F-box domain-containing protein n=1 Tax=Fusarium oxysporum (strain Fo5176) TaxID=660025 RepID=A0A0C4DIK2_FUSOF
MAQLKDIPNEILTSIFTYVSDINHSSIFNVTLVNKHFNQIASPLRVRHWSDEGFYGYYQGESPCPPISRLALELLRHPEYRLQVKTLSFSYFQSSRDRDAAYVPMKPENLQTLAWAAEGVVPTLAESTYLCARIREDVDDAIAVI